MAEPPNVRLILASRADSVSLVREILSGIAEVVEVGGTELDHMLTAVSEACNNVVLHAYQGAEGPLEVEIQLGAPETIGVVVRDRGGGIRPRIRIAEDTPLGIGVTVIHALARRVEFGVPSDGAGTEVRMAFDAPGTQVLPAVSANGFLASAQLDAEALLLVSPAQLAPRLLARMLGLLASRADFCGTRIADVQLLADLLLTRAPPLRAPTPVGAAVAIAPRELELRIGPLDEGSARREVVAAALNGLGQAIEMPRDEHSARGEDRPVWSVGCDGLFAVKLVDRRTLEPS
jgi:serine/threonine-protein kinase RsbW